MLIVRACAVAIAAAGILSAASVATAGQGKASNYKGLEISALSVARAQNVPLVDCPPGTNTQRGNAKDGEEFAVVTLAFGSNA